MTDLAALAQQLRTRARSDGAFVLDGSVVAAEVGADLRIAFGLPPGADVAVAGVKPGDIPDPAGGELTIAAGTIDGLGQRGLPMRLTFTAPGGVLQVVISCAMAGGWRIADSFPALTMFPFPDLAVTDAHFVFTTAALSAYPWPGDLATTVALVPGLNLLAHVTLGDFPLVATLLGAALGPPPFKLHGPFAPTDGELLPVVDLRARLGAGPFPVGVAPDTLTLANPTVGVRLTATAPDDAIPDVDLVVEADIEPALHFTVHVPAVGTAFGLEVTPLPPGGDVLHIVESLPGGAHVTEYIPTELADIFAEVGLDGFTMAFDTSPEVNRLGLAVGTQHPWPVIPDVLELEQLSLRVETLDPSGLNVIWVQIEARTKFLPKVFGDADFDVTVGLKRLSKWEVDTVSAAYGGVVALGDVVAGVLGDAAGVPEALRAIQLSDFGVTATRASSDGPFSYTFHGSADAHLPLHELQLAASLHLVVTHGASGETVHLAGAAVAGDQAFSVALDLGTAGSHLSATWADDGSNGAAGEQHVGTPLGLADLADAFGWSTTPDLPPALDLALQSAGFTFDYGDQGGALVVEASSLHYGEAVLQTALVGGARVWVFGAAVPLHVTLADLPLVGGKLPDADQLGLAGLGAWLVSRALTKEEVAQLDAANTLPVDHPRLPDRAIDTTATLFGSLLSGAGTEAIDIPVGAPPPSRLAAAPGAGPPTDHTRWFSVERTFGIFTIHRVGLQYVADDNALLVDLDAQIALGPLTVELLGLAVGSPLTTFRPTFQLRGLGLSYAAPPIRIEGALYALPGDQLDDGVAFQYDGVAVVEGPTFSLGAVASYAQETDGSPSLFVFAQLRLPLGGPPAFFVTGLMGGFGFNRSLALPPVDEVSAFPLLALGAPPGPGLPVPAADPARVLGILEGRIAPPGGGAPKAWIAARPGQHWLAFGVEFTTFELLESRALLVAELGTDLVFALLGLSTLRLPRQAPDARAYVYAELSLDAVLRPAAGSFALTAVLSPNSYVLAPAARLTGGFALSAWFGDDPRSGQFAFTIGGYHPAFSPPAGFPGVPRVGLSWAVSDVVTITGSAYLALTTSCAMAGGSLEVLYHSGSLRAWFTAHADVLVSWHPFSFVADVGVSIGVSYTLDVLGISKTLTASLGASMTMWGPPTGGTVTVHLWFVSFTVDFGARPRSADDAPLAPAAFAELLPAAPVSVTATGGLSSSFDDPETAGRQVWVVRTGGFSFATDSAVPAATVAYGGATSTASTAVATGLALDVRPMGLTGTASTHTVRVQNTDDGTWQDLQGWSPHVRRQARPASLWGAPLVDAGGAFTQAPSRPSADVVAAAPVGAAFALPGPQAGRTTGVVDLHDVAYVPVAGDGRSPLSPSVAPTHEYLPAPSPTSIAQVQQVATGPAAAARTALVGVLHAAGLFTGTSDPMTALAADAEHLFTDSPLVVS